MALYRYVKQTPKIKSPIYRIVSVLFMGVGLYILLWTIWPIISFSTLSDRLFAKTVSPLSEGKPIGQGNTTQYVGDTVPQQGADDSIDYSNANTWFPTKPQKKITVPINVYHLSIPKVKVENAAVTIGGDDLNTSLIHYGGTALPGQYGNTVVFGHSTLPQFYNPKSYKTIFSLLPTLVKGDQFVLEYDGITYQYEVYDMVVVDPTDLSPLEQKFDDSYATLVTCVPPGTYWKRLNVKAKLIRSS